MIVDEVLGELRELEAGSVTDGYALTALTLQGPVDVEIHLYGTALPETLPLARALVKNIDTYLESARRLLISDFLPLHNAGNLGDGEAPVAADAFVTMAGTPLVSIDLDGEISLTYLHDDLLWGHFMGVSFHPDGSTSTDVSG